LATKVDVIDEVTIELATKINVVDEVIVESAQESATANKQSKIAVTFELLNS
jgi:hypothetical protein